MRIGCTPGSSKIEQSVGQIDHDHARFLPDRRTRTARAHRRRARAGRAPDSPAPPRRARAGAGAVAHLGSDQLVHEQLTGSAPAARAPRRAPTCRAAARPLSRSSTPAKCTTHPLPAARADSDHERSIAHHELRSRREAFGDVARPRRRAPRRAIRAPGRRVQPRAGRGRRSCEQQSRYSATSTVTRTPSAAPAARPT